MYKKFIAIDQYGNTKFLDKHPRKELTEYFGVKHAEKIYRDTDEGVKHVGYIVAGHWYQVMRLSPLEE
jgi:hypothetical protein